MFTFRFTAGRLRRLTRPQRSWWTAALLALSASGLAAAAQGYPPAPQGYPQQPQSGAYAQQGYQPGYQPGPDQQDTQQDPPSRVARLSVAQGNISVQPANVQDFSPAEVNYPLTTGDRVWADAGSLAELQIGQAAVRLGQQTDFTVTALTDTAAQFGLAQGSVHLRTFDLDPNSTTELDTPNASVIVLAAGDVRVDVFPGNITVVTLISGAVQVNADGVSRQLRPGESMQIAGSGPAYAQDVRRPRPDGLDGFSSAQDSSYQASILTVNAYVSDDVIGAQDLGSYGDWSSDADYGPVWFPRAVAVGWQPYRYGHWAYVGPWGWTWVESEPWGFAPFHYGRWCQVGGRWGWIPGPRVVRPVYSPALVAFVGGSGGGVTAWFPLGPREPFQPWYRTSDRYVTRVNVTNIYNRNTVEVRNVYLNAGRGPSPFRPDPNRQYVNRPGATVAVPQNVFASGRPVLGATLRVDSRQFGNAPVLARPEAAPTRAMMAPAPARALPPRLDRPVLQGPGGNRQFGRQPGEFRGNTPQNGQNNGQGFGPGGQAPIQRGPAGQAPGQQVPGQQNPGQQSPSDRGQNGWRGSGRDNGNDQGIHNDLRPAPNGPYRVQPQQPAAPAPVSQSPGQQAPGQRPGSNTNPQPAVQQPADPGFHRPVGPARGQFQPSEPQQTPSQAPTNAPGRPQVNQPQPSQPQPPQAQPRNGFDGQRPWERNDGGRTQAAPPANNGPQNRPAAPQQPQFVPRPAPPQQANPQAAPRVAPQAQPQPRPAPQPQPAAKPQSPEDRKLR